MTVLVVAEPTPLVSIDEAMAHLRHPDGEEELVSGYIAAASAWVDGPWGWLGQCISPQVLEVRGNVFSAIGRLPYGPLIETVSLKYVSETGVEVTMPAADYVLTEGGLSLAGGATWPRLRGDANGVRLQYRAGFARVPAPIKQAVLLLVGQWFAVREATNVGNIVNELPLAVRALLGPYRIIRV